MFLLNELFGQQRLIGTVIVPPDFQNIHSMPIADRRTRSQFSKLGLSEHFFLKRTNDPTKVLMAQLWPIFTPYKAVLKLFLITILFTVLNRPWSSFNSLLPPIEFPEYPKNQDIYNRESIIGSKLLKPENAEKLPLNLS